MQHVIDLTDEQGLLVKDRVANDRDGVRSALAALNLKPAGGTTTASGDAEVFDFAVYRATGDRHLATLFGTAA